MASSKRTHKEPAAERYTFFWRSESPFSQFHPAVFTVDGQQYTCAEQYMMYRKASYHEPFRQDRTRHGGGVAIFLLFEDKETAELIMQASQPHEMKALGRGVRNFDEQTWKQHCRDIVKNGNIAKFSQNEELKQCLLKTEGTVLVEASPRDQIWGIGLAADNPAALTRRSWRGSNWLGFALTDVRQQIKDAQSEKIPSGNKL